MERCVFGHGQRHPGRSDRRWADRHLPLLGDGPGNFYPLGSADGIAPGPGANVILTYSHPSYEAAVRWESGNSQLVYFAFGFENLGDAAVRDTVLQRSLAYFGVTTGIPTMAPAATAFRLAQNVPNPFYPSTTISYQLARAGPVELRVFDVHGRLVRTLVSGSREARLHRVEWNGRDDRGQEIPNGVNFYQLTAGAQSTTRRFVVVR